MPKSSAPLHVTAIAAAAQLGGTERVLLDFANRAFEYDIALRVLTPRNGPLVKILNGIGVPTEVVPASKILLSGSQQPGHLWSLPPALFSLLRWSRRLKAHPFVRDAEVVYSVAFKTHLAAAMARLHPVVWHLHEFPPAATGRMWRFLAGRVPDHLIANSEAAGAAWAARRSGGQAVKRSDRPPDRPPARPPIAVIPNGVNLDRFKPRDRTYWIHDELGIPREHRLIGMPAVFARWKGQLEVIEAFGQTCEDFPDVHMVIVGGSIYDTVAEREYGELLKRTTGEWQVPGRTTDEWEVPISPGSGGPQPRAPRADDAYRAPRTAHRAPLPRVHMLPFQQEIELAYPEFELAVHYSLRPEPFGRVVLEAMACGVPIVAANEGGPVEIVGGGIGPRREAGWLVEPRNPDALAAILRSALGLPTEVLHSIGAAGRIRAEDHFSSRAFAGRVAEVLRQTATGSGERGAVGGERYAVRGEREG